MACPQVMVANVTWGHPGSTSDNRLPGQAVQYVGLGDQAFVKPKMVHHGVEDQRPGHDQPGPARFDAR